MTGTTLAALIREYTLTNSTTLTDAKIVTLGNVAKDDLASTIAAAKEDAFVIPATRNLIADQREYDLPADILNALNRVEVKFTSTDSFIEIDETDMETYKDSHTESVITSKFSNSKGDAFYDRRRGSIYIYSGTIVAVTSGLKIWYNAYPQDIVAGDLSGSTDLSIGKTSTQIGLDRMFHELWARKVSIIWKSSREKPIPLSERELSYKDDLEEKIADYKIGNTDRAIVAKLPDDTRYQLGNTTSD